MHFLSFPFTATNYEKKETAKIESVFSSRFTWWQIVIKKTILLQNIMSFFKKSLLSLFVNLFFMIYFYHLYLLSGWELQEVKPSDVVEVVSDWILIKTNLCQEKNCRLDIVNLLIQCWFAGLSHTFCILSPVLRVMIWPVGFSPSGISVTLFWTKKRKKKISFQITVNLIYNLIIFFINFLLLHLF